MWPTLLFSGTAGLLLTWAVLTVWHLRWARRLPPLETFTGVEPAMEMPHGNRIKCSVVIAARNEEERLKETIRHLFAQGGVEAECIVVDDRSTDRTSEILQRLAREDARLRMKRVDVSPEGWASATHVTLAPAPPKATGFCLRMPIAG